MKKLKTYKELFEYDNWSNDIEEKKYFLTDDELDYDKWYKEWRIDEGEYTKLTSNKSGWVMFKFPPIEPDWDESPTYYEIEWEIDNDSLKYSINGNPESTEILESDIEEEMANYIMFHLLEDEEVKIRWFINEKDMWFTEELAMKFDNLFDYTILEKEAEKYKKHIKANKFNL